MKVYPFFKRVLDLLIAVMALIILLPVFVPVIFILAFSGEREIFYFQERIGFRNKPFNIYKFATMVKDSPNTVSYTHLDVYKRQVQVGANSFIGANSVVREGIKIGSNVIIGAGSVVVKPVPDHAKLAGNPARGI